jgi:hypothetical protein
MRWRQAALSARLFPIALRLFLVLHSLENRDSGSWGPRTSSGAEGRGRGTMRRLTAWLLGVLAMVVATGAYAETVSGDRVNCRSAARATASVLGVLRRGQDVPVLSRSGAWSYVDRPSLPACYVRSDLLGYSAGGYATSTYRTSPRSRAGRSSYRSATGLYSGSRYTASGRRRSSSGRSRSRSRGLYDGGGSCPCSGSNICIGPRGGRYCITSGGNKRYGV